MQKEEGYGLVLSGGGTKGAYEVGAWKALRELRIPIRGIVGTFERSAVLSERPRSAGNAVYQSSGGGHSRIRRIG